MCENVLFTHCVYMTNYSMHIDLGFFTCEKENNV